ncbi:hypothetical protein [Methylobacterium sp. SI9]|uniref:hypothetical protein n=1 Tax=Methylobacterium guangdongense TaxID=3138811 RepID=UPI00313D12CC
MRQTKASNGNLSVDDSNKLSDEVIRMSSSKEVDTKKAAEILFLTGRVELYDNSEYVLDVYEAVEKARKKFPAQYAAAFMQLKKFKCLTPNQIKEIENNVMN